VAIRNRHGCSLYADGAHRAASTKALKSSVATGFAENARGLQRSRNTLKIGKFCKDPTGELTGSMAEWDPAAGEIKTLLMTLHWTAKSGVRMQTAAYTIG
jgi:hypothetical protein